MILRPHFVIIGGGFCGTMVMVNLIHQAESPLHITLLEKSSALGRGIAYGTTDPCHLLNVRAYRMGAFADNPEHFYQWLSLEPWRDRHPEFKTLEIKPFSYLPRMLYGFYLENLLQTSLSLATQKGIQTSILRAEACNIETNESSLSIELNEGHPLQADAVILALGVPQNKEYCSFQVPNPHYISTIWSALPTLNSLSQASEIIMIGSGLTMVDAYLSLLDRGYQGKVTAISRHGILPGVHTKSPIFYPHFIDLKHPPATALKLFKTVRRELKLSSIEGVDWRGVVDELREIISPIWVQFSWNERKKACRHLLNLWNYFRHRMPEQCWSYIQKGYEQGRFNVEHGKVMSVEPPYVTYRPIGADQNKVLKADTIINCSGADMNIHNHKTRLMQNLIKNRLVNSDPLKTGILADPNGDVKGAGQGRLFAVGQLLFGERLESTAVPDLRNQCHNLAAYLLRKFRF